MNSSHNTFIDFPLKIKAYKREEKNPLRLYYPKELTNFSCVSWSVTLTLTL